MKETLTTRYREVVSPFLTDGVMQEAAYKPAIDSMHTDAVLKVKSDIRPNPVLGRPVEAMDFLLSLSSSWASSSSPLLSLLLLLLPLPPLSATHLSHLSLLSLLAPLHVIFILPARPLVLPLPPLLKNARRQRHFIRQ